MKIGTKKSAFTLAEVLITLAVIGVVAGLTIPSLMKNVQETQWKSAFKTNFSTLQQAWRAMYAESGGNLKGSSTFLYLDNVVNGWGPYLKDIKSCQYASGCWHTASNWYELDGDAIASTRTVGFVMSSGALYTISIHNAQCTDTTYGTMNGKGICGHLYIDVNGFKGPNTVGKDIYLLWIQEDRFSPYGTQGGYYVNNCTTGTSQSYAGFGCAAKVLQNVDY